MPRPTTLQTDEGSTRLEPSTVLRVDPTSRDLSRRPAGEAVLPGPVTQTTEQLGEAWRAELREVSGLEVKATSDVRNADTDDIVVRLVDDAALGAEGYRLDTRGPVVVEAASTHGAYYGTRTLNQLLATSRDGRTLPSGTITDRPSQQVRMVQLDAARKYWSMTYLENLIRRMGQYKLNTLFLHLSESEGFRLDSPRFPGLADPASSYSREDIERLKSLGAKHHVQIMGGIDVPGHATAISKAFGIGMGAGDNPCGQAHTHSHLTPDWIVDMTSPRAVDVSKQLVAEFSSWFDAPMFSIGADELPGQLANCPRVKDYLASEAGVSTLGDLLTRYINTLDGEVRAGGKRTAIFNGVEHMSSPEQDLNPSVVMLTWEGTGSEPAIPGHDEIAIGPFYNTPNNYHSHYPDATWTYDTWSPSDASDMLGSGMPSWADYNFWAEDAYFEQFQAVARPAMADRAWNRSSTADDVTALRAKVAAIGDPPGVVREPAPTRTADGKPSHHWTFDTAAYPTGWIWAGSPGNTILAEDVAGDLSGTSYIINNPTVVDGLEGDAFRFDNSRDGVGFGGMDVAEPWTVSVWVKLATAGGNQVLLSSKDGALKLSQPGTGRVGLSQAGGPDLSFDYSLPVGQWTHLTWSTTRGSTSLHVDGERVSTMLASIALPMRSVGGLNVSLRGDLDELKTWDETLSADAVAKEFDSYGRPANPDFEPTVASLNSHETPTWFDADKFGIFIHWGAYSVPAWGPRGSYAEWYWNYMSSAGSPTHQHHKGTYGEDYAYDRFIDEWKAEKFDADEWTSLFQEAGAKYFVLTSKHHEGVSLFDSDVTTRDTVDMGPKRDLAKELFDSAREKTDLKAGFYYSLYEWFNPNYTGRQPTNPYTKAPVPYTGVGPVASYVQDYMLPQMTELVDKYDPDILWCDGQWEKPASYWNTAPVLAHYYNQAKNRPQPKEVAVANRCKIQSGALDSPELDFQTPEYTVKPDIDPVKWESSRGIAHSYGYNQNEPIEDYLTSDQLVDSLVDIVSKNGNLLLDIGPRGDGTIPELQAQRLRDIGAWLKVNGEAIYGTTYFTQAESKAASVPVRYTLKGGTVYATALAWPGATLRLDAAAPFGTGTKVTLLGSDGTALPWTRNADGTVSIGMPENGAAATTSANAFVFKIATPGVTNLPRVTIDLPAEAAPGSTVRGSVTLRNEGTTPIDPDSVRLDAGSAVVEPARVEVGTVPEGESLVVPVTVTVPDAASGSVPVTASVDLRSVTVTARRTVAVQLPNLARGKDVSQASLAWGGVPERAVDGNRDGAYPGNSVTHTAEPSNQAWWQVDLGGVADVDRIDIFNRTDCCAARLSNYWVIASPNPITGSLTEARSAPGVTAVRQGATAGRPTSVDLPDGVRARYVRVQLESSTDPLSLAEVEVRGVLE